MNDIKKHPVKLIGYNFIPNEFLPKGKDEYHLRHIQNRNGIQYRHLSAYEIEVLVRNNNTSDDWNKLLVSDAFDPELVKHCKFFWIGSHRQAGSIFFRISCNPVTRRFI